VFVVGCLGDSARAAQVLFERESVQRDSSPRRAQGEGFAADAQAGARAGCYWDGSDIANTLTRKGCDDRMPDKDRLFAVLQPVAVEVADALVAKNNQTTGFQTEVCAQPVPYDLFQITAPVNRQNRKSGDPCHTLERDNAAHAAVAFNWQNGGGYGNANEGLGITVEGTGPIQRCNTPAVAHAVDVYNQTIDGDCAATLTEACGGTNTSGPKVMAFKPGQSAEARSLGAQVDVACTLEAGGGGNNKQAVAHAVAPTITAANDPSRSPQSSEVTQQVAAVHAASMTVRRLTPRECERLQGFPDDYTAIPWRGKAADQCPDGPRYKALGNSMAVNCMAWIGERIHALNCEHDQ
jgi:DNA (cytosine-5)-methyltransferase 1